MSYTPVQSSNVHSYRYDDEEGKLYVRYQNGREYCYHGVNPETALMLGQTNSVGKLMRTHIIPNHRGEPA